MSSPSNSILSPSNRSVIGESFWKTGEEGCLKCDVVVSLFIDLDRNENRVVTATLCERTDIAIIIWAAPNVQPLPIP